MIAALAYPSAAIKHERSAAHMATRNTAPRGLSEDERTILSMFAYMRPHGTPTEAAFVERFLTPLGFQRDAFRNLYLEVGPAPASILWSSHMDTVHSREGIQTLHYDGTMLALSKRAKGRGGSSCLGADDTAGIWLMTEMVKAKVPGLYVIHHGEEQGCIGSSAIADRGPGFLDGIEAAIAFDRKGYGDVITHQSSGRTASDAFARSLARILGGAYQPDDTGSYTDTNEYAHLVPECTNISVGYSRQHSVKETQDVPFLIALRDTLVAADWSTLVIERDPADDPYADWEVGSRLRCYDNFDAYGSDYPRKAYGYSSGGRDMDTLCRQYPEIAADLLEALGVGKADFMDRVADYYGNSSLAGDPDDDPDDWQFNKEPQRKAAA